MQFAGNSRLGSGGSKNRAFIRLLSCLSSTLRWGCGYVYGGTASGSTDQRFYASTYGRFNTADPFAGSAGPGVPGSWNRYAYVLGDPVNSTDRTSMYVDCDTDSCDLSDCDGDPISCMMADDDSGDSGDSGDIYESGMVFSTTVTGVELGEVAVGGICVGSGACEVAAVAAAGAGVSWGVWELSQWIGTYFATNVKDSGVVSDPYLFVSDDGPVRRARPDARRREGCGKY